MPDDRVTHGEIDEALYSDIGMLRFLERHLNWFPNLSDENGVIEVVGLGAGKLDLYGDDHQ